jgi:coenzyme F420 hydrogenase subunit beta
MTSTESIIDHLLRKCENDKLKHVSDKTVVSDLGMPTEQRTFGTYLRLVLAQSTNQMIRNVAQNGGVVTGLLTYALENRVIDGAIVSAISREKPFYPVPMLATDSQVILESAGTRYTYSPNTQVLREITRQNKRAIAFVGTPCQITAVRKMQKEEADRARPIKLLIGLMCSEAFVYEDLMIKHVQDKVGINLGDVRKTQITGKMMITTDTGRTAISLNSIRMCVRKACRRCSDFSSELADISVGGLGLGDWTFVVIRTAIGMKIFTEAERAEALVTRPVREDEPSLRLLAKLSENKRNRAGNP